MALNKRFLELSKATSLTKHDFAHGIAYLLMEAQELKELSLINKNNENSEKNSIAYDEIESATHLLLHNMFVLLNMYCSDPEARDIVDETDEEKRLLKGFVSDHNNFFRKHKDTIFKNSTSY